MYTVDSRCVALKKALREQITALVEIGMIDLYSAGADAVDCWATLIVLELRKNDPAMKLRMTFGNDKVYPEVEVLDYDS